MTDVSAASNIQAADISPEEQNYLRVANLLLRVAPSSVRIKFDNELHPGGLNTVLNQNRFKILEPLKQKRIINQAQWDLLFPISGTPSSKTFDLTLMICLIRNLTNIEIGDAIPFSGNKTDGADLTRIKYYRNKIMHSIDGILSESNFKIWWDEISEAIIRLGGVNFKDHCILMKLRKLDRNDKEILTEIKNIIGTSDPIPKGLRNLWDKTILEWKKEQVAETRAITRLAEMIASDNVAVAVGPSGCGKSTAIHNIALQLALLHNYDIIIAYNPEDMRQLFNSDCKQVFVIDDILGVATFDENKARKWTEMSNDVNRILEGDHTKLLASCKTHIFQHRIVQSIKVLSDFSCNFVSIEYSLTLNDRENIAKCHLTTDEIVLLKASKAYSAFDFFPVLCRLYSTKKSVNIVDFFSNPIASVSDDLYLLLTDYDQTTFATLFLFIVYNNCVTESLISDQCKIKPLLEVISDHFICKSKFSIQVVKDEFEKLKCSYIKKQNTTYTIIHNKIFDILMHFCSKYKYDLMLEIGHTDIIRDRFIFERLRGENADHVGIVIIPLKKEKIYLERLKKDSEEGFILNVFSTQNLNDRSFRTKFITHVLNEIIDSLSGKSVFLLLMSMIDRGFRDIVSILLTKEKQFDRIYWDGETPLFKAACNGFTDIVRFLLIKNADPNFPSCINCLNYIEKKYPDIIRHSIIDTCNSFPVYSPPPLNHSFTKFEFEILEVSTSDPSNNRVNMPGTVGPITSKTYLKFLSSKKNPQFVHEQAYEILPIHIAVSKGYTDIVKLLLTHNAEPDYDTGCHQIASPLYIASYKGNTDIVKLLLENKPRTKVTVPTLQTVYLKEYSQLSLESSLHIAVLHGFYDIVRLLLIYKVDLYQYQEHLLLSTPHTKLSMNFYWNMVSIAIVNDHEEILKLLLEQDCNLSMRDAKNVQPLLFMSICEKKTEVVKVLLEKNFDSNICYGNNETPLYRATHMGQIEIVQLLLTHKSDPNVCYKNSMSPLLVASSRGYTEIVKLLLHHNCDPNICSKDNESALFVACSSFSSYTDIVKLLLDHKCDPNICNKDNESPLFVASQKGHTENVKLLLDYKCDPNICNKDNKSALFVACSSFCNCTDIVKLLLYHKCDPNICNKDSVSPLSTASTFGNIDIVKLLLDHNCDPNICNKDSVSPLSTASIFGHIDVVKLLLDHNCDPNICNKDNKSPLFFASRWGHTQILKLLLAQNCDPNICNKDNESPLFVASQQGHTDNVKLLLDYKCDPNICNKDNESALFVACSSFWNCTDIVKLLLDHKCDPNICNKDNESPLFVACASKRCNIDIVKLLLDHKSDPNMCNKDNESPLFVACASIGLLDGFSKFVFHYDNQLNLPDTFQNHIEIMKLLLDHNCDPNICNKDNTSPLFVASLNGYTEIVNLLINYSCDPNICNKDNESPLQAALRRNHTEIVDLLNNYHFVDICHDTTC